MKMTTKDETKLALFRMRVRSEVPRDCIGYVDFLTEENFPETGQFGNFNLIRLEQIRPGTMAEFAGIVMFGESHH